MVDVSTVRRNVSKMIDQDAPETDIDAYIQSEGFSVPQLSPSYVDSETGAPAGVRAIVGGLTDQPSRLATLQQYYPDAQVDPDDPENFIFTHPETGLRTRYNPPGFDPKGDLASLLRETYQTVGGGLGIVAGGAAGLPTGPGALASAALGGAGGALAGEGLFQATARMMGMQDLRPTSQKLAESTVIGAGGMGGPTVGAGTSAAIRGGIRGAIVGGEESRQFMEQAVRDAVTIGIDPSLSVTTNRTFWDGTEQLLAKVPGAHGFLLRKGQEANAQAGEFVATKVRELAKKANVDATIAGRAVQKGLGEFRDNFRAKSSELYQAADALMPAEREVALSKTREVSEDLVNIAPDIPELNAILVNQNITDLAGVIQGRAAMPYDLVRQMRSAIGRRLSSGGIMDDLPRAELKQIYGALSDDIKTASRQVSETAYNRVRRADNYYKAGLDRIESMLAPMIKQNIPEKVFQALETSGRQGATRLRTIRNSVDQDQWNVLRAGIFERFGRATPGQQDVSGEVFSVNTFLTNWNRLAPEARTLLLNGDQEFSDAMNAVARYSSNVRDSSKLFANPSGTSSAGLGAFALMMSIGGTGSALVVGKGALAFPAIMATGSLGARGGAELMQNPRFVKWLSRATEIDPQGWAAHIGELPSIAAASSLNEAEALQGYIQTLNNTIGQNIGTGTGETDGRDQ